MLQPSHTVRSTVRAAGAPGTAADPRAGTKVGGITIGDVPVEPAGTYRITVNSFLAGGGDGFSVLTQAANDVVGWADVDALTAHLGAAAPGCSKATSTQRRGMKVALLQRANRNCRAPGASWTA